jgi:hypothetical protein
MPEIKALSKYSQTITWMVGLHAIFIYLNGYAHAKSDYYYSLSAHIPLLLIFGLLPIFMAVLLQTQKAKQGILLGTGILPATVIYNIISRFSSHTISFFGYAEWYWKVFYEGTYGLMIIFEVLIFVSCIRAYKILLASSSQQNG